MVYWVREVYSGKRIVPQTSSDLELRRIRFRSSKQSWQSFGTVIAKSSTIPGCNGYKSTYYCTALFNAAGQFIQPFILFSGKRDPVAYNPLEGAAPGSPFAVTEKGYMNAPTFYLWLANHFIPHLSRTRPVVFLVDSPEAHVDLHTFAFAEKNNIFIFALLKNATHLL